LNPNYDSYLQTATQLQRWRDFQAQVAAYLAVNIVFVIIWAVSGRGFFWPVYPLVGCAVGLSFQHFSAVLRGQITDENVRRKLRPGATEVPGRQAATWTRR
jgi:2TM domain